MTELERRLELIDIRKPEPGFLAEREMRLVLGITEALEPLGLRASLYGGALSPAIALRHGFEPPPLAAGGDIDMEISGEVRPGVIVRRLEESGFPVRVHSCLSDLTTKVVIQGERPVEIVFREEPIACSPTGIQSYRWPVGGRLISPYSLDENSLFTVPEPERAFMKERGVRAKIAALIAVATPLIWGRDVPLKTLEAVQESFEPAQKLIGCSSDNESLAFWLIKLQEMCRAVGNDRIFLQLIYDQLKLIRRLFLFEVGVRKIRTQQMSVDWQQTFFTGYLKFLCRFNKLPITG